LVLPLCTNKVHGDGGVLKAIHISFGSCRCRYDLKLCFKCIWIEIPTVIGIKLLIGNFYFSPDTKLEVIIDYFCLLESIQDTNNFFVILLGDFSAPGFNCLTTTIILNSGGNAVHTTPCLLGLRQCTKLLTAITCLTYFFANFTDLNSVPADFGFMKPGTYNPPLDTDILSPLVTND
jgi:hypothetical protein